MEENMTENKMEEKTEENTEHKVDPKTQPDLNIVQIRKTQNGDEKPVKVGAMWKNMSKDGKMYYNLAIGNLRLLVFENTFKKSD